MIKNGLLTVNEVRALEGLPAIKDQWQKIFTGVENAHKLPIFEYSSKIVCEFCSRPNETGQELCQSCGAPLRYPTQRGVDSGDSPAQLAFSTPEVLSASEGE